NALSRLAPIGDDLSGCRRLPFGFSFPGRYLHCFTVAEIEATSQVVLSDESNNLCGVRPYSPPRPARRHLAFADHHDFKVPDLGKSPCWMVGVRYQGAANYLPLRDHQ